MKLKFWKKETLAEVLEGFTKTIEKIETLITENSHAISNKSGEIIELENTIYEKQREICSLRMETIKAHTVKKRLSALIEG